MRLLVVLLGLTLIGVWLSLSYYLLGAIDLTWLQLELPKTTSEFGDSVGILNGLFSAIAVILALVAVLLQGKELKESTKAQNDQAEALRAQLSHQEKLNGEQLRRSQTMIEQLQQQQIANQVIILQAQQQYHSAEIARMDVLLDKLTGNHEKVGLFNNCVAKKNEHISELNAIHSQIEKISKS